MYVAHLWEVLIVDESLRTMHLIEVHYVVFGPHYKPEVLAKKRHRSRSPSPLQPRTARLVILFHIESTILLFGPAHEGRGRIICV